MTKSKQRIAAQEIANLKRGGNKNKKEQTSSCNYPCNQTTCLVYLSFSVCKHSVDAVLDPGRLKCIGGKYYVNRCRNLLGLQQRKKFSKILEKTIKCEKVLVLDLYIQKNYAYIYEKITLEF
ncbi:hypothetical protein KUTeg_013696 [Tegillarca granosa]|uniref:Uncharacterized protein n=1 Tax=Tegillarca granosa TaxID=220873 RepID=A0ABQ9EXV4_TEGGR|nr:hypothetical protein KUTeg_013696 [Tegillarca granosa]